MPAFQLTLKPSKMGRMLVVVLHLIALVLCWHFFENVTCYLGLVLLLISFCWAWYTQNRLGNWTVQQIAINPQGQATLFIGRPAIAFTARLIESHLVTTKILFLKWDLGDRKIQHCVMADMVGQAHYRRLRVWAKWGQPKSH